MSLDRYMALFRAGDSKNETFVMAIDSTYSAAQNEFDRALEILYSGDHGAYNLLMDHVREWRRCGRTHLSCV